MCVNTQKAPLRGVQSKKIKKSHPATSKIAISVINTKKASSRSVQSST